MLIGIIIAMKQKKIKSITNEMAMKSAIISLVIVIISMIPTAIELAKNNIAFSDWFSWMPAIRWLNGCQTGAHVIFNGCIQGSIRTISIKQSIGLFFLAYVIGMLIAISVESLQLKRYNRKKGQ